MATGVHHAGPMAFTLKVEEFAPGQSIPRKFTCEDADHSPALAWSGAPPQTRSFALVMDDPDAPGGVWTHWLLWGIPAATGKLAENARPGAPARSGTNDFGRTGYGGPCPPRGHGPHRYFFRLLALDTDELDLPPSARRADFDRTVGPHVLATAEYMGRYERK